MDYNELVRAIKGYSENDFPLAAGDGGMVSKEQVDTFIRQAEQRIYNTAQFLVARQNKTANVSAGNPYLTAPIGWLSTYSMAIKDPVTGNYEYLLNKDVNFIRECYPPPGSIGKPTHYALFDENTFLLGPTPDFPYFVELHYNYYPQSIVDAADGHTWLGDTFDIALLYGALLEAHAFMKGEPDVLAVYQQRYSDALSMIKQYAEGELRQDMYRTEQVRYPVR